MTQTTYEQAQRLIKAGIDLNTSDFISDCHILRCLNINDIEYDFNDSFYPVWSMEALYNVLPFCIHSDRDGKDYYKEIICEDTIAYSSRENVKGVYNVEFYHIELESNLINNLVSMVVWYLEGAKQDEKPTEELEYLRRECEL